MSIKIKNQKKVKTFKFKQWEVYAVKRQYENGRIAIQLMDAKDHDLVATSTVNIPSRELPDETEYTFIKNYSENEGMIQALLEAKIIEPPLYDVKIGYALAWCAKVLI